MPVDKPRLRARTRTWLGRAGLRRCLLAGTAGLVLFLCSLLGQLTPAAAAEGWGWPLEPPEVVHEFDPPDDPYGSGHRGVDLAGSVGQDVTAPSAGVVTFAGVIAGRGVVVVSHGSVRSTLEPVAAEVVVGMPVGAGERVATLQGFAHHCDSPCLHWGVLRGDTYLDPLDFVGAGPSRLLPWWDDVTREGGTVQTDESSSESVLLPAPWPVPLPAALADSTPLDGDPGGVQHRGAGHPASVDPAAFGSPALSDASNPSAHSEPSDALGTDRSRVELAAENRSSAGTIAAAVVAVALGGVVGRLVVYAMRRRQ